MHFPHAGLCLNYLHLYCTVLIKIAYKVVLLISAESTLDSLNEGMPKNNQIKVSKKNDIVSIEKIVGSVLELSTKRLFLICQVPVKKKAANCFCFTAYWK